MLRAAAKAQKKQGATMKKASKTTKKATVKSTRKVVKRTMTTKRAAVPTLQQPQQINTQTPLINKPISFVSSFHKPTTAPAPVFIPQRLFGGHAAAAPAPETYMGVQVQKYGKMKFDPLYTTDSPTYKNSFIPIAMDGSSFESRPTSQEMTPEEMIAKYAVILVDKPVAVCDGTAQGPHPREFIQVHTSFPKVPQICKYCGNRFMMKSAWDGSVVAVDAEEM